MGSKPQWRRSHGMTTTAITLLPLKLIAMFLTLLRLLLLATSRCLFHPAVSSIPLSLPSRCLSQVAQDMQDLGQGQEEIVELPQPIWQDMSNDDIPTPNQASRTYTTTNPSAPTCFTQSWSLYSFLLYRVDCSGFSTLFCYDRLTL